MISITDEANESGIISNDISSIIIRETGCDIDRNEASVSNDGRYFEMSAIVRKLDFSIGRHSHLSILMRNKISRIVHEYMSKLRFNDHVKIIFQSDKLIVTGEDWS
jgi:hypothetical protein